MPSWTARCTCAWCTLGSCLSCWKSRTSAGFPGPPTRGRSPRPREPNQVSGPPGGPIRARGLRSWQRRSRTSLLEAAWRPRRRAPGAAAAVPGRIPMAGRCPTAAPRTRTPPTCTAASSGLRRTCTALGSCCFSSSRAAARLRDSSAASAAASRRWAGCRPSAAAASRRRRRRRCGRSRTRGPGSGLSRAPRRSSESRWRARSRGLATAPTSASTCCPSSPFSPGRPAPGSQRRPGRSALARASPRSVPPSAQSSASRCRTLSWLLTGTRTSAAQSSAGLMRWRPRGSPSPRP
mmetsp:Transcript_22853/g.54718  ORF Transcript_22853/g.54718 Transcript_22853/m.54718 type:complete len:293 (+) Transcript_22853:667-1545(+)